MKHLLVKNLEKKLLPEFQEIVDRIIKTVPNASVRACSSAVGSLTNFQGHSFFIDCMFVEDILSETDNVALGIELCHLTTVPKINADVCWRHPSGHTEANFPDYWIGSSNDWIVVLDKVLEDLYKDLPRLYEALFRALKRRKPGNE